MSLLYLLNEKRKREDCEHQHADIACSEGYVIYINQNFYFRKKKEEEKRQLDDNIFQSQEVI